MIACTDCDRPKLCDIVKPGTRPCDVYWCKSHWPPPENPGCPPVETPCLIRTEADVPQPEEPKSRQAFAEAQTLEKIAAAIRLHGTPEQKKYLADYEELRRQIDEMIIRSQTPIWLIPGAERGEKAGEVYLLPCHPPDYPPGDPDE